MNGLVSLTYYNVMLGMFIIIIIQSVIGLHKLYLQFKRNPPKS